MIIHGKYWILEAKILNNIDNLHLHEVRNVGRDMHGNLSGLAFGPTWKECSVGCSDHQIPDQREENGIRNTWGVQTVEARGWDRKRRTDRLQPAGEEKGGEEREEKEEERKWKRKKEDEGRRRGGRRGEEGKERREGRGYRYSCSHGRQQLLSPSVLPCHCPVLLLLWLQDRGTGYTHTQTQTHTHTHTHRNHIHAQIYWHIIAILPFSAHKPSHVYIMNMVNMFVLADVFISISISSPQQPVTTNIQCIRPWIPTTMSPFRQQANQMRCSNQIREADYPHCHLYVIKIGFLRAHITNISACVALVTT